MIQRNIRKASRGIQITVVFGLVVLLDGILHVVASQLSSWIFWRETWVIGKRWTFLANWNVTHHLLGVGLALLIASLFHSYTYRRRAYQFFRRLGIPGPKPHLIKGNGDKMRNHSLVAIDVMDQWKAEFGDVYGYFVGMKPYVVVGDLDMVQQVLIRDFHKFVNRPAMGIEIRPVINTLVGLRSHRWKEVRRVISPTFSTRKMRKINSIINRCADILVEVVGKHAETRNEIDFYGVFQGLTCQVIGECALDTKVDCQRQPQDEFLNSLRQFLKQANNPIIDLAIYFPLVREILAVVCRVASPCGQFTQSIIDKVQGVINQRREDRLSGTSTPNHGDILQLLMEASENRQEDTDDTDGRVRPTHQLLTDDEIIANAWVFLLGGFETTANALTYCAYLLATHADVQQKLYEELRDYLGESSGDLETDYNTISQLTYLDKVFCEALRLFPPVVLFVTREAAEDAQLGDFHIPAGTNVQIPIWQIHHDPKLWPDPYRFDPERFEPELKKNRHPMAWIPFGSGPRSCLGIRFAMLEAKIALAKLLMNYRLVPCERTEEKLTLSVPTVTLNPKSGVWLKAEKREQTSA